MYSEIAATFQPSGRSLLRDGCPIGAADIAEVRHVRSAMLEQRYRPLAIHSPYSLACDEASAAKQPLTEVVNSQKLPWRHGHSRERLRRVTAVSANTGLLLGGDTALIALDIDPAKGSAEPQQCAFTLDVLRLLRADRLWSALAAALIRLRAPASVLMLLRADTPVSKSRVQGERGAVELLGEGQQCLVHGWHPKSLLGTPVRWIWHRDRTPWTVPVSALPVIPSAEIEALMQRIGASGVLGAPREGAASAATRAGQPRASAYAATARLNALFDKHDGLVRPAIRELVQHIGTEGTGRHDAIVAVAGRIVMQRWTDEQAVAFLVPLVNEHFGEGDWTAEIEAAIAHAHKREAQRLSGARKAA